MGGIAHPKRALSAHPSCRQEHNPTRLINRLSQMNQQAVEVAVDTKHTNRLPRDSIAAAGGVVILLVGTATGSAHAMLAMAAIALAMLAVDYRHQLGRHASTVITIGAATAAAAAFAIALIRLTQQ